MTIVINKFPFKYLMFKWNDGKAIYEFLNNSFRAKFELNNDNDLGICLYYGIEFNEIYEALQAFLDEGIINTPIYCSKEINSLKDFELDYDFIKKEILLASSGVYDSKSLLFKTTNASVSKDKSNYVLKNYANDTEMKNIINKFFEADLNVSKASKMLYLHRNTLIYKLDRFYEITGYDIRKFNDACFIKQLL